MKLVEIKSSLVPPDAPGALAVVAVRVNPVSASERRAAFSAIVPRSVWNNPAQTIAVVSAPVFEEVLATVTPSAMLAKLVGPELTVLA